MREWAKTVGLMLLVLVLLPIWCVVALFYDEDPEDSYRFQNW